MSIGIAKIKLCEMLSHQNREIKYQHTADLQSGYIKSDTSKLYSKHPHIRTNGLRTSGWNLAHKAPFKEELVQCDK